MNPIVAIATRIGLSLTFGVVSDIIGVALYFKGGDGQLLIIWDVLGLSVAGWVLLKWTANRSGTFWIGFGGSFLCGCGYLLVRTLVHRDDEFSLHFLSRMLTWGAQSAIAWCVVRACLKGIAIAGEART